MRVRVVFNIQVIITHLKIRFSIVEPECSFLFINSQLKGYVTTAVTLLEGKFCLLGELPF